MSEQSELQQAIKRLLKSQQTLVGKLEDFTAATMALASGVHALADALASAAGEPTEDEPAPVEPAVERYADGSPVGG